MAKKSDNWMIGYSNKTGKYVPIPIFGNRSYRNVKSECNRLNKIAKKSKKQKGEK